jgi:hypothetical protein
MRYLIITSILALSACTNRTQDPQNTRNDKNPNLHTVGYIGDVAVQVGFADIKE